jgi:hypothetical protein
MSNRCALSFLTCAVAAAPCMADNLVFHTAALSGQVVGNRPAIRLDAPIDGFLTLSTPTISAGRIAVVDVRNGLWEYTSGGGLRFFAANGSQMPRGPWNPPRFGVFDGDGNVTGGYGVNGNGLVTSGRPGSFEVLASANDIIPGTNRHFREFSFPAINTSRQVAFSASQIENGASPAGVWIARPGSSPTPVALPGDQASGTPAGARYSEFPMGGLGSAYSIPRLNNQGEVLYYGFLQRGPGGVTEADDLGLWRGRPGQLSLVFREGETLPTGERLSELNGIGFNDGSTMVGEGTIDAPNSPRVLLRFDENHKEVIARRGETMPWMQPGESWWGYSNVKLDGAGKMSFTASLLRPNNGFVGVLCAETADGITLAARQGMPLPDIGPDITLSTPFGFSDLVTNAAGDLIFQARLAGPGMTDLDQAIFHWAPDTGFETVLRTNTLFEVAPGDMRMIQKFNYLGMGGGQDGWASSLGDGRNFAFQLIFTNGSSGIFYTTLPAPGVPAVLGIWLTLIARRRRA